MKTYNVYILASKRNGTLYKRVIPGEDQESTLLSNQCD